MLSHICAICLPVQQLFRSHLRVSRSPIFRASSLRLHTWNFQDTHIKMTTEVVDTTDATVSSIILSWLFLGTKIVGGLLITLIAILYTNQEKMLYMPNPPGFPRTPSENPPGYQSPATWSAGGRMINPSATIPQDRIEYEEHFVKTSDGVTLHTWLLLQPNSSNVPTLIYFHGNAGNMGFLLKNAALMFAHSKINILLMDYRGYGRSEGVPSEKGINLDAEAVLKFALAHPRLTNSRMVTFGRSLGGAVAISLAHRFPDLVSGVVVENTFLSVGAMVDVLMPFLKHVRRLVLYMNWDSDVKVADLKMPILFISGDSDELVPASHMRALYNLAARCPHKEFYSVLGGTHNDTFEVAGAEYYRRLGAFIRQHVGRGGASGAAEASAVAEEAVAPTAVLQRSSSSGEVDEEGYLVVDNDEPSVALPTMTKTFQVK